MIQQIRKHLPIMLLVALIMVTGCKSKKKAMEAANAAEKTRMEQEQAEKKLKAEELARQEQEAKEAKERVAREEEARIKRESKESAPAVRLGQYFGAIASSSNATAANNSIKEALNLFASPETPVLIVISDEAGTKDYDKPTTIKDYLNYLKDQKKNINTVSEVKTDGAGKITELELRKN